MAHETLPPFPPESDDERRRLMADSADLVAWITTAGLIILAVVLALLLGR